MQQRKKPYISVIINNYNYGRFLHQAIASVLRQNFTDYELIVVDDASTDHSRDIISLYADQIIPVLLAANSGQGAAFNAGFTASSGELIAFLDADDLFVESKLSIVAEAGMKKQDAVMFYHQGYLVDGNLNRIGEAFPAEMPQGNLKKRILLVESGIFPPTSFVVFRRSYLSRVLPLSPFMTREGGDFPLIQLAPILGEIAAIPHALTYYRVHGDNWFSNGETNNGNLRNLREAMRRTEKGFYYLNKKLNELGLDDRFDLMKSRDHIRNCYIFNEIGWMEYVFRVGMRTSLKNWKNLIGYLNFGVKRRRQYLSSLDLG
jgi:glycosyltransferase involved in cell wall biosynthesis